MNAKVPRSPYDSIKGLAYFPRMLDKIRLNAQGALGEAYLPHIGNGFDGRCLHLLHINYDDLTKRTLAGGTDEEILEWCFENGRRLTEEEIEVWTGFMQKRGWRDDASERIAFRLKEAGLEHRDKEAVTMFDFIDLDEGRTPPDFRKLEPPRLS